MKTEDSAGKGAAGAVLHSDEPAELHVDIHSVYAASLSDLVQESIREPSAAPIIGILGPWGAGKTSLLAMIAARLSHCQVIWFRPTHYGNEREVAAAFFSTALREIQLEATGLRRLRVKCKIWWHSLNLKGGLWDLIHQILRIGLRLVVFIGGPILVVTVLFSSSLKGFGAILGGAAGGAIVLIESVNKAFEPGLAINRERFVHRIAKEGHARGIESYVDEFKWIANVARGTGSPLVVMVDALDDGLPTHTALILEVLRLFGTGDVPCVFVVATDSTSLTTAIRTRFLAELQGVPAPDIQSNLEKMADAYISRVIRVASPMPAPPGNFLENLLRTTSQEKD